MKRKAKPIAKSRKSRARRGKPEAGARARPSQTKTQTCLALLDRPEGASIAEMQDVTGWQPHSVRGFLAGTVKKMPGLTLASEKTPDQPRRYRVHRVQR